MWYTLPFVACPEPPEVVADRALGVVRRAISGVLAQPGDVEVEVPAEALGVAAVAQVELRVRDDLADRLGDLAVRRVASARDVVDVVGEPLGRVQHRDR